MIGFWSTENWTDTANGTEMRFFTAANGTNARAERIRITENGNVGIGTTAPTQMLDVNSNGLRIRNAKTPASSGAACNQGEMAWDSNYVYVCVLTNTWRRATLALW